MKEVSSQATMEPGSSGKLKPKKKKNLEFGLSHFQQISHSINTLSSKLSLIVVYGRHAAFKLPLHARVSNHEAGFHSAPSLTVTSQLCCLSLTQSKQFLLTLLHIKSTAVAEPDFYCESATTV